jgi:hypothetical protein
MDSPLVKEALMRVLLGIFAVFFLAAVTWASIPVAKQHGTVSIDPIGLTATKTNLPVENTTRSELFARSPFSSLNRRRCCGPGCSRSRGRFFRMGVRIARRYVRKAMADFKAWWRAQRELGHSYKFERVVPPP